MQSTLTLPSFVATALLMWEVWKGKTRVMGSVSNNTLLLSTYGLPHRSILSLAWFMSPEKEASLSQQNISRLLDNINKLQRGCNLNPGLEVKTCKQKTRKAGGLRGGPWRAGGREPGPLRKVCKGHRTATAPLSFTHVKHPWGWDLAMQCSAYKEQHCLQ